MLNSLESSLSSSVHLCTVPLFARLSLCIVFKVRFALPKASAPGRARIEYQIIIGLSSTFFGKFDKKMRNFFASVRSHTRLQNRSSFGWIWALCRCFSFPFVRTDLSRLIRFLPFPRFRKYPDTVRAPSVFFSGSSCPPRLPVSLIHPAGAQTGGRSAGSRRPFSRSSVPGPG